MYNGAIGRVVEIIYDEGKNPNDGHLPSYVVVDMNQYSRPTWDENSPTVSVTTYCCIQQSNLTKLNTQNSMFQFQSQKLNVENNVATEHILHYR